jgi:hypothetical protein
MNSIDQNGEFKWKYYNKIMIHTHLNGDEWKINLNKNIVSISF